MKWPSAKFFEDRLIKAAQKKNEQIKEQNNQEAKELKDHMEQAHQVQINLGLPLFLVNQGYADVGYKADLMTLNALQHLYNLWQSSEHAIQLIDDLD